MPFPSDPEPARSYPFHFTAATALLTAAAAALALSFYWSAAAARELERVADGLLRLQSFSASIHKYGEASLAESATGSPSWLSALEQARREALNELSALRRMPATRPGWKDWIEELVPLVERRLASVPERPDGLSAEIDRRLNALEEDELVLLQEMRRKSRRRVVTTWVFCGLFLSLSLIVLSAAFRSLAREVSAHRDTAEKFSKAFHGSPIAMAIVRAGDGALLEVNRSLERLCGRGERAFAGATLDDLPVSVQPHGLAAALFRIPAEGPLRDIEAVMSADPNRPRSVLISADVLTLRDEPCVFASFYDITDRKRAESALRDFSGALIRAEQRERRRLAQILHDNLQQTLSAVAMHVNLIRRRNADAETVASAAAAGAILKEAVQTARSLSYELCPPAIARGSLGRALRWLGGQMKERHNLEVSVELDDESADLPESVQDFLVAAARELLFNVVKHAGRPTATLRASRSGGWLRLEVRDEGPGFELSDASGAGLASIRERIGLFGGRLEAGGVEQGGRVALVVPVDSARREADPV